MKPYNIKEDHFHYLKEWLTTYSPPIKLRIDQGTGHLMWKFIEPQSALPVEDRWRRVAWADGTTDGSQALIPTPEQARALGCEPTQDLLQAFLLA